MPFTLEICVQGIESALAAQDGGADRIELCEDLAVGGVTPSAGMIVVACRRLSIPVHVLIRPRGGDFEFSQAEFDVMRYDVETAKRSGAAGVVLGCLGPDGSVDLVRLSQLVALARPMAVTFHRAFDDVQAPFEALEALIGLGVERVLTSGGPPRAVDALAALGALTTRAGGRISILAGGRVQRSHVPELLGLGLQELHVGSAVCSDAGQVDATKVRRFREGASAPSNAASQDVGPP